MFKEMPHGSEHLFIEQEVGGYIYKIKAAITQVKGGINLSFIARDKEGRFVTQERIFLSRNDSEDINIEKLNATWGKIMRALEGDALEKQKQEQLRETVKNFLTRKSLEGDSLI